MAEKELRDFLSKADDKVGAIAAPDFSAQLTGITTSQVASVFKEVLSQEELLGILNKYQKLNPTWKKIIIGTLPDDKQIEVLHNEEISGPLSSFDVISLVEKMQDAGKMAFLHDDELLEKNQVQKYQIVSIATLLSDEGKMAFLHETDYMEKYEIEGFNRAKIMKSLDPNNLEEFLKNPELLRDIFGDSFSSRIVELLEDYPDEDKKIEYARQLGVNGSGIAKLLTDCSDRKKEEEIFKEGKYSSYDYASIIGSMDPKELVDFYSRNLQMFQERKIELHDALFYFSEKQQLDLANDLNNHPIPERDKLRVLVKLNEKVKDQIDRSSLTECERQALDIIIQEFDFAVKDSGYINIDWEHENDFAKYECFDDFIAVRPQAIPAQYRSKVLELGKHCPNISIRDNIGLGDSTFEEYREGQAWIDQVLSQVNPEWSDIQKCAFIDNAIGKRISYSPDFGTEVEDMEGERALWHIISTGKGVCNGIAQIEQYMLKDVGIESMIISSGSHAFLKLEGVDIPQPDGSTIKGDTVLDGTWNLASQRYGAYPNNFFRSYEEIRKHDILPDGTDKKCHKNDELLSSCTHDIDEQVLRKAFTSVGLAFENGFFPISKLVEASDKIAQDDSISFGEKMEMELRLLAQRHPDFSECLNSSSTIITDIVLDHKEMPFEKIVADRVYDKEDKTKRPVLYVYGKSGSEEYFYTAEDGAKEFTRYDRDQFIEKYECYDKDLAKSKGIRPWEQGAQEVKKDLAQSSGKVLPASNNKEIEEGDER